MSLLAAILLVALQTPMHDLLLVSVAEREGESFCSISAPRAALAPLLVELAKQAHMELEGLDLVPEGALCSVELRGRPLALSLEWILGNAGMRAELRGRTCVLQRLVPEDPTPAQLRELALAAYARALRSFPSPLDSARAELAKATIHVQRGDFEAALHGFDLLVRTYPESPYALEGASQAAQLLIQQEDFTGAADRFASLLRLDPPIDIERDARAQLARCKAQAGEYSLALKMVHALDVRHPPRDAADTAMRIIVLARCELGLGHRREADAALASLVVKDVAPELEGDLFELRALMLNPDATPEVTAQAWLAFAVRTTGARRNTAFVNAARATSASGNPLDLLFLCRYAQQQGAGDALAEFDAQARAALGLARDASEADPALERLQRAERLVAAGLFSEARSAFAAVQETQPTLTPAARLRLYLGFAQSLEGLNATQAAIDTLRAGLSTLENEADRRAIYLYAAELFERHDRLDEAIEAYRGRM